MYSGDEDDQPVSRAIIAQTAAEEPVPYPILSVRPVVEEDEEEAITGRETPSTALPSQLNSPARSEPVEHVVESSIQFHDTSETVLFTVNQTNEKYLPDESSADSGVSVSNSGSLDPDTDDGLVSRVKLRKNVRTFDRLVINNDETNPQLASSLDHELAVTDDVEDQETISQGENSNDGPSMLERACMLHGRIVSRLSVAIPLLVIVGLVVPALALLVLEKATGMPEIDVDINSFRITNHPATESRLVVETILAQASGPADFWQDQAQEDAEAEEDVAQEDAEAEEDVAQVGNRSRRSSDAGWKPVKQQAILALRADVYYIPAAKDGNMLDEKYLDLVHDLEIEMINRRGFTNQCFKFTYHYFSRWTFFYDKCYPPLSAMGFFYPSPTHVFYREQSKDLFVFDGLGSEITDFDDSFAMMKRQSDFYSYFDSEFSLSNMRAGYIKTQWWFGQPLTGYSTWSQRQKEIQMDYFLGYDDLFDKYEKKGLKVNYYIEALGDYLVRKILTQDIMRTVTTVILISILVLLFTGLQPWLTFWTIVALLGSIIDTLFIFRVVLDMRKIGMLNGAAGVILVSIGVDDCLVFINTFKNLSDKAGVAERLGETIKTAAYATFLTSFTTSLAFGGNIISPIPAVKNFGLFMALLVMTCWLLVVLILPPSLFIWDKHLKPLSKRCLKYSAKRLKSGAVSDKSSKRSGPYLKKLSKIAAYDSHSFVVKVLSKVAAIIVKIRWVLMFIWAGLMAFSVFGVVNMEISNSVPRVFSEPNRFEAAIELTSNNAYTASLANCYECHPLLQDNPDFFNAHFNTTPAGLVSINMESGVERERRSAQTDPEKPLSTGRPLVAVMFGLESYSVQSNSFYTSVADVKYKADDDFFPGFDGLRSPEAMSAADLLTLIQRSEETVRALCKMCDSIAKNGDLVNNRRGQCLPDLDMFNLWQSGADKYIQIFNRSFTQYHECRNLPSTRIVSGNLAKGVVGFVGDKFPGYMMFVFESKLELSHTSWEARDHFIAWQVFLKEVVKGFPQSSGVTHPVFFSDIFDKAFMEITARVGSLYSVGTSVLTITVVLTLFTGHLKYLLVIMVTVLSCVVSLGGSFYYFGIKVGAVEIVAASILVGSSVDYVFHLVEAYSHYSANNHLDDDDLDNSMARRLNCVRAFNRVGLSIISSSLTTAIGCIPLVFAGLHPLKLFGILIIVSSVSALMFTMFFALPLLAIIGPVNAGKSLKRSLIMFLVMSAVVAFCIFVAFVVFEVTDYQLIRPDGL